MHGRMLKNIRRGAMGIQYVARSAGNARQDFLTVYRYGRCFRCAWQGLLSKHGRMKERRVLGGPLDTHNINLEACIGGGKQDKTGQGWTIKAGQRKARQGGTRQCSSRVGQCRAGRSRHAVPAGHIIPQVN